jgi:DNA processing protein
VASPAARIGPSARRAAQATEREAWAIVATVDGLGPAAFAALLARYGDARSVLAAGASPRAATRFAALRDEELDRPWMTTNVGKLLAERIRDETALDVLRRSDGAILTVDDEAYPGRLRAIELPPPVLFVQGTIESLAAPRTVAVVGTRRPTEAGRLTAARIGAALSGAGAVVVSGLAVGIDGAAHSAVADGGGATVAVLGSGLDQLYPRSHARLASSIVAAGGAIVSEFWPSAPPSRRAFPQRNRLISGLSEATVVVEAPLKSGALLTAEEALRQGRALYFVPGRLDDAMAAGCLDWLRRYAGEVRIVAGIEELLEDLGLGATPQLLAPSTATAGPKPARRLSIDALFAELGPAVRSVGTALVEGHGSLDELVAVTELEPATVLSVITILELRGLATSTYGRYRPAGRLAAVLPPRRASRTASGGLPARERPC